MTRFVIVVDAKDDQEVDRIVAIARRYNLEHTITNKQLYLFIADADILVNVAHNLHDLDTT